MMAMQQRARNLAPQRYTISQLLQIARDAKYPFDLSKFTYDAARAGVVPPLGEIAVSSRRSSSQRVRSRGWSSESIEATSEIGGVSGNANMLAPTTEPRRQPSNPPTGAKSQKDAGFAKFLKKHSSPTHNRVTTGGRIVPMEKRDSPPKFDLQQSFIPREDFQSGLKDAYDPLSHLLLSPSALNGQQTHLQSPAPLSPTSEGMPGIGQDAQHPPHFPSASAAPFGFPLQSYGVPMMAHYPIPSPYYYMPSTGFPANHGYMLPNGWQQSAPAAVPSLGRNKFDGVEPTTQLLVTAQSCLSQAQSQYDLLDRQLKSMDRHRAMSTHDPTLAAQRMAVVQQRSELKAMINRLLVQVDMLQNSKPLVADSPSKFAPSARPFIPASGTQPPPGSPRAQSNSGSVELMAEKDRGFVERSPGSVPRSRKVIPILPPPPKNAARNKQVRSSDQVTEIEHMWEVDQWGVRYRAASDKSMYSTQQQLEPNKASVMVKTSVQYNSAARKISAKSTAAPEIIGWHEGRPGPLPEELVDLTESYYDALRLPVGVITVFNLPNEDTFEVCGAALQPGDGAMSEVEQSYWMKKPTFTKLILNELRHKARIVNGDQYDDEYLLGTAMGTVIDGRDMQDLLEEAMSVEADRRRQQAASAPSNMPLKNIQEEDADIMEDLSNKGFSSTSVQNVHATVRLPPSFDGTTDNSRRDAKTSLSATNKNHSPRVLHRSAPGGGA